MANLQQDEVQTSIVTDLRKKGGGRSVDGYYLTVLLSNNTELELPIDGFEYNNISPGDSVEIFYGKGALGIEYAYLNSIP